MTKPTVKLQKYGNNANDFVGNTFRGRTKARSTSGLDVVKINFFL